MDKESFWVSMFYNKSPYTLYYVVPHSATGFSLEIDFEKTIELIVEGRVWGKTKSIIKWFILMSM